MFFADAMLGRLAKWMRVLGFDTMYVHDIEDDELVRLAQEQGRLILTRDTRLAERLDSGEFLFIRDDDPAAQLVQVFEELHLDADVSRLFSRCLECNSPVEEVGREDIAGEVPEYVLSVNDRFTRCTGCGRVYWPGTHVSRILDRLAPALGRNKSGLRTRSRHAE